MKTKYNFLIILCCTAFLIILYIVNVPQQDKNEVIITAVILFAMSFWNLYCIISKATISCKHDYQQINHFEIPSEFDIVLNAGKVPNTHCSQRRKYVTDYKCSECGKLKRKVEFTGG